MMDSLSGLIAMGGYGVYVWPAYLAAAVLMIGLVIESRRRIKRNETLLAELEALRGTGGGSGGGAGQTAGGDET